MCNIHVFVQEHQHVSCPIAVTNCCTSQKSDGGNKSRKTGAPAKTTLGEHEKFKAPNSSASNKDSAK